MTTELYSDGSITLSAGSETVTGTGTAWAVFGVNGGLLTADGLPGPIPIAAVPGNAEMTLAWPSPVSLTTASYAIVPWTAEQMRALWANRQLSQMIARAVGVNLARSAFGSVLSDRDAYDGESAGFAFVLVEEHEDPVLYLKLSDEDGDWSPAKPWRGPAGTGAPGSSDVVGSSTSSVAIGIGAKTFTVQENRGWGVGARLRVTSNADPANFMEGVVTSYSGTSLQLAVNLTGGVGTFDDWTINIAGQSGQTLLYGSGAPASGLGSDGDHYIDRSAMALYGPKTAGAWGSPTPIVTAAYVVNLDGGNAFSIYGGVTPVSGGDAFTSF